MADSINTKNMSYDEWKALGPLFQNTEGDGDNFYDGTRHERPTTPKWASLSLGGPNKVLGNPNHTSRNDAFTNAHSQWMHIMKTLDAGDKDTLNLVREMAKAGNKMSGLSERMHGREDAWVALASDSKTAGVLRGAITSTLAHFPADKGVLGQKLPTKIDDIPLDALKKDMEAHRPKRLRRRVLDNGIVSHAAPDDREADSDRTFRNAVKDSIRANPKSRQRQYAGTIAIFADDGLAESAAEYINTLDERILACPEKNGQLWKVAGDRRKAGTYLAREYDPNLKQGQAADQLLGRADAAVFFVNGDPSSRASGILAQASRLGKAVKIVGPDGLEMPLMETAREAEAAHMSKKEIAQSFNSHAFDMPASDPMAFLGLSQVRDSKIGRIDEKDLSRISDMKESVNEIADMAEIEAGRQYLRDDIKLSAVAIRLLANKDAMDMARRNTLKLRTELGNHNMEVIGPKDYPEAIIRSGSIPPYLIVEGNKDTLRNAETIVGFTGAQSADEREQRLTSSTIAKGVSALTMQPTTVAYVQGQTSVDVPETGPQIMISATGAAHIEKDAREKQLRIVENGGVVIHMLPPENRSWHFDPTQINPQTGKKGLNVAVPSKGDHLSERSAAKILGSMSDTVFVGALNAKDPGSNQHTAILAGLKAGRAPTVANFKEFDSLDHVSGNRAMLGSTGAKAMTRAGFHDRDVEDLFPKAAERKTSMAAKFENARPAIDTGKNMDIAMPNLVRHLKGLEIQVPENVRTKQSRKDEHEI